MKRGIRAIPLREDVLKSVSYDPETGIFTRVATGGVVGDPGREGYLRIRIGSRRATRMAAHRLAWLIMTGEWPAHSIDHKNQIKSDNRWCNLRKATDRQQNYNQGCSRANKSGQKGVFFRPRHNAWVASIRMDGKKRHIGHFSTKEAAAEAYEKIAAELHGEFFVSTKGQRS